MKKVERILICILALALAGEICVSLELHRLEKVRAHELAVQNASLQVDVDELRETNSKYDKRISELNKRVREITDKSDRGSDIERAPEMICLGEYTVTAYCSCEKCCGEYAKNRPEGKVYGAAGVELTPGVSVAGWLPLGTQIMIDGHEYTVQDRTAAWIREKYDGRIIDIYFDSHKAARAWGKQKFEVFEVMQ